MPARALMVLAAMTGVVPEVAAGEADPAESAPTPDIVVVGERAALLRLPGSAAVISDEDMRRARIFNVNEALRTVPGLFPRDEEGLGLRPNIGIRGLNPVRSTKVLLLEDGIPLAFAPYGDNASYYHPPVERFSRIEVLKGAAQVRFGPQTIGGVVNYITPAAPAEWMARGTVTGGNRGNVSGDAMIGGPALGGRLLLHGTVRESDGFRANHRLRFSDLYLKGEWDLGETQTLTLRASRFAERSQVSYSGLTRAEFAADPRGNPFPNDRFDTERLSASLAHGITLGAAARLKTTAYYHYFDRDWWRQSSNSGQRPNDASDPACGGMANLLTACGNEGRLRRYHTAGVETRLTLDHDALGLGQGDSEVGVRYHRELQRRLQWNGDTPTARTPGTGVNGGVREDNVRKVEAFAAFAQSTVDLGAVTLQPGVRAELVRYDRRSNPIDVLAGGRPTGAKTGVTSGRAFVEAIVPGLGAVWRITDDVQLFAGVHRGFAPPRVEDIITAGGGSVDLEAEKSWNYEAGARFSRRGISGELTLFAMDFENQIIAASVAGGVGTTLTSAGRTQHRGAELALKLSSRDAGWTADTDIFARGQLTWVERARFSSTRIASVPCFDGASPGTAVETGRGTVACGVATDVRGNRLPYSPEWLGSLAVGVTHGPVTVQVEAQGQSRLFADDINLVPVTPDGQRGVVPGWVLFNAAVNWVLPGERVTLFATVKNIGNRLTIVDRARGILPGTPRLFQGGAQFAF
ncbi:TonB-dependent receptor family protein [Sandaracinobacteroides saxicola]|uniref:TonB-dependent receptor n=1 Tax=Sandaracinobacteroides saxicola TaxID=2759707 RepID=A0A7G5IKY8_9SPHN|nr:TonB-dependent receptor [Sandaracinobacteroides saxicola]QMW24030.1 TonB-dependent receptor [Sandaracinobacteroides saxicola]